MEFRGAGSQPGFAAMVAALKACRSAREVRTIHKDAVHRGEASNPFVATALIQMYARCGSLAEAFQVFQGMDARRSIVPWNCLIQGCVERDEEEMGLGVYDLLFSDDQAPNHVTFLVAIKACTNLAKKAMEGKLLIDHEGKISSRQKFLRRGKEIHSRVARMDGRVHIKVLNSLIDLYATCGRMVDASLVFEGMDEHSVVSWTEMILGFAESENQEMALELHTQMQREESKEASDKRPEMLRSGKRIHAQAARNGQEMHIFVANALVDMYSKCGNLVSARQVFEEGGEEVPALELFGRMREEGICVPNHVTFLAALKACAGLAQNEVGTPVEGKIVKLESLSRSKSIHSLAAGSTGRLHAFVANSLIHTYAQCGSMDDANRVFSVIRLKDQLSWGEMILGYAETGEGKKALDFYARMKREGCPQNHVTILAALKGCVSFAEQENSDKSWCLERGREIHRDSAVSGDETHIFVASALVDMYAKCGSLAEARDVFEKMEQRNTVSWNSLILGCTEDRQPKLALELFSRMKAEGFSPDAITYAAVLKACGRLGALELGREVEQGIYSAGIHDRETSVCNSLVDFYGKCGSMVEARRVFDRLGDERRDIVSWNALIDGYSRQGDIKQAFESFDRLCGGESPVRPNGVTFLAAMILCSHAGLVDRAKSYFQAMVLEQGLVPETKHFTCLVDMLGRADRLDEAVAIAESIGGRASDPVWTSILSASSKWKNASVGKVAFDSMKSLETSPSAFVLISDIYKC